MEQSQTTLDFEALMALGEEERAAALSEYGAALEKKGMDSAAEQYKTELRTARYESAKYKMALDKSLPNFSERIEAIEEIIASNEAFGSMSDEERLRTAYYIDRGRNASAEPTVDELFALIEKSPEVMGALEVKVLEKLRAKSNPPLSAGKGSASMPLTPKAKPKNLSEASALAREAFGV